MKTVIYSALDKNYLEPYKVMMLSLHDNGCIPDGVDYFLLTTDLTKEDVAELPQNICVVSVGVDAFSIDVDGELRQDNPLKVVGLDMLKDGYNKAIYLDCDLLVMKSLKHLCDMELDFDLAGSREHNYDYTKSIINSGVMVVNMDTVAKYLKTDLVTSKHDRDQEIINKMFASGAIKYIPQVYNWIPEEYIRLSDEQFSHLMQKRSEAHILHYATKYKPWMTSDKMVNNYTRWQVPMQTYLNVVYAYSNYLEQTFISCVEKNVL